MRVPPHHEYLQNTSEGFRDCAIVWSIKITVDATLLLNYHGRILGNLVHWDRPTINLMLSRLFALNLVV